MKAVWSGAKPSTALQPLVGNLVTEVNTMSRANGKWGAIR
jgi:hypothetical protein